MMSLFICRAYASEMIQYTRGEGKCFLKEGVHNLRPLIGIVIARTLVCSFDGVAFVVDGLFPFTALLRPTVAVEVEATGVVGCEGAGGGVVWIWIDAD